MSATHLIFHAIVAISLSLVPILGDKSYVAAPRTIALLVMMLGSGWKYRTEIVDGFVFGVFARILFGM